MCVLDLIYGAPSHESPAKADKHIYFKTYTRHTHTHAHIHTRIHANTHTTHTHTHIHTHTQTPRKNTSIVVMGLMETEERK